jgi:hypothetical protein
VIRLLLRLSGKKNIDEAAKLLPRLCQVEEKHRQESLSTAEKIRKLLSQSHSTMLKLQAIFHDGLVGLEFMTNNPPEAEEMREQMLAFECVREVMVLDEPDWVKL